MFADGGLLGITAPALTLLLTTLITSLSGAIVSVINAIRVKNVQDQIRTPSTDPTIGESVAVAAKLARSAARVARDTNTIVRNGKGPLEDDDDDGGAIDPDHAAPSPP